MYKRYLLLIIFHPVVSICLLAQTDITDLHQKRQEYFKNELIKTQDEFPINGKLYNIPSAARNGYPFLFDNLWHTGKISVYSKLYDSLLIRYDAFNDVLVYQKIDKSSVLPIIINPYEIDFFILDNHTFRYHEFEKKQKIKSGFYESFDYPDMTFLYKWKKTVDNPANLASNSYVLEIEKYLIKDGISYHLKNKKSILKIFPAQKDKLKKYMKTKQIIMRDASTDQIVDILNYYHTL